MDLAGLFPVSPRHVARHEPGTVQRSPCVVCLLYVSEAGVVLVCVDSIGLGFWGVCVGVCVCVHPRVSVRVCSRLRSSVPRVTVHETTSPGRYTYDVRASGLPLSAA